MRLVGICASGESRACGENRQVRGYQPYLYGREVTTSRTGHQPQLQSGRLPLQLLKQYCIVVDFADCKYYDNDCNRSHGDQAHWIFARRFGQFWRGDD